MLLRVFVRAVIGIGVQLDGLESWLLGKAASFVAVNDTIWRGSIVAVLRCPVFGGGQSADTIVVGSETVGSRQYAGLKLRVNVSYGKYSSQG